MGLQTLKAGCEMKIEGKYRDKLHFEGAMRDRTTACEMVGKKHNFRKRTKKKKRRNTFTYA